MTAINIIKEKFPIEGDYVLLSLFSKKNITHEYLNWLNDSLAVKYSKQRNFKHNFESALIFYQSLIKSKFDIFIAINHKKSQTYIGTMTLSFTRDFKIAEARIFIGNKIYWGKGLGFDAWNTILNWLFIDTKVEKVHGGTLECNIGMINIMKKSKMSLETVIDNYDFIDGVPQKALIFSKIKEAVN